MKEEFVIIFKKTFYVVGKNCYQQHDTTYVNCATYICIEKEERVYISKMNIDSLNHLIILFSRNSKTNETHREAERMVNGEEIRNFALKQRSYTFLRVRNVVEYKPSLINLRRSKSNTYNDKKNR